MRIHKVLKKSYEEKAIWHPQMMKEFDFGQMAL